MNSKINNLTDALAHAMRAIGPMAHDGRRSDGKYSYVSANALKASVQTALSESGVALALQGVEHERADSDLLVTCTWLFCRGDERLPVVTMGAAQILTKNGALMPEAVASAQTRSLVSALRCCLLIPEAESEEGTAVHRATQARVRDPEAAAWQKTRSSAVTALHGLSRRPDCPDPEQLRDLREVVVTPESLESLREAVVSARAGDWSALGQILQDAGGDGWADKTQPSAQPSAEPSAEQSANDSWGLPSHTPRQDASAEYRRKFWTQILQSHPDYADLPGPRMGWDDFLGSLDLQDAVVAAGAEAMCIRLDAGDSPEQARIASKSAVEEAIR